MIALNSQNRLFLLFVLICLFALQANADVLITTPNGGQNISADRSVGGAAESFTNIGDIVIADQVAGDFATGTSRRIQLNVPTGWQFEAGIGNVIRAGSNLTAASITVSSTSIVIIYTASGTPTIGNSLTISDIRVKSTSRIVTAAANITRVNAANQGTITGFINGMAVATLSKVAGAFTKLQVLLPGHVAAPGTATGRTGTAIAQNAGTAFNVTVNAVDDAFNIVYTAPNDNIQITASANGIMPANEVLNNGSQIFSVTLNGSGTGKTITATNITDATKVDGVSGAVTVNAGVFTKLQLLLPGETADPGSPTGKIGVPNSIIAGTAFTVTVNAVDDYWNKVTSTNSINISSTGATNFIMPANNTLNAGTRNFNVTFKVAGEAPTLTATNITNPAIVQNTSSSLVVNSSVFVKMQILLPGETAAPGTTTGKIGTPVNQAAGVPFAIIVNAVDANWNVVSSVTDVVEFTNTNAAYTVSSILPVNAALVGGTGNFSVTLNRAVAQQLRVADFTDNTKTASTSASVNIDAGTFAKLQILLPGETAAPGTVTGKTGTPTDRTSGTAFNITVNAVDNYWNKISTVTDNVGITSSDSNDIMPAVAQLVAGSKTNFSVTLKAAGTRTLTAIDLDNGGIINDVSALVNVNKGAFAKLQILLPGETAAPGTIIGKTGTPLSQMAGVAFNVTVNAVDASWNKIDTIIDEISISSTDANAVLPANNFLVGGTQVFNILLKTAGNRTITALDVTDGSKTSSTSPIVSLSAGSYAKIQVLLPGETAAPGTATGFTGNESIPARNTQFSIRILPVDNFYNIVAGITHTINLTTSDLTATVPASSTLVNGGTRTLNVNMRTTGAQTITVVDGITSFITTVNVPDPTIASLITDHFRSVNSGNWNNTASWESSTDGSTNWHSATITPTSASSTITIRNGHVIAVTASVSVDEVDVQAGGEVVVKAGTMTIANGTAATDFSVSGILTNSSTITPTGTLSFTNNSRYKHAFTTISGTIPTATWSTGSICEITSYTTYTGNVAGSNQTFSDFIWNCPEQNITNNGPALLGTLSTRNFTITSTGSGLLNLATTGGTVNVLGNFSLISGIVSINKTSGTANLNVAGNFALIGGTLQKGNGISNVFFNGTTNQTYSKSLATIAGAINFTINANAIVDFGTSVIDGTSGDFTMLTGASLITANSNGFMASGINAGTIQNTGTRTYNTGNYTFNGNTAQLVGSGMPLSVTNLTIANPQGVTMPSGTTTYTINGQLSINPAASYLDMATNVLSGSFTNVGAGTLKTQSTSAFAAGRTWNIGVEYNSPANQNIIAGTYNALLTTSGNGVKSGPSTLNIAGNWSSSGGRVDFITNNTTVNFNGSNQSISDSGSNSGNGLVFRNVNFSGGDKTLTSGNFSVAEDGILTMSGSSTLNANGHLTLLSNASSSATVAAIPSTSSIRGQVKVQRFVGGGPQNPYRTYRMFSSPVYDNTTSFINSDLYGNRSYNFNQFIDDMIISGAGGATNGFDATPGNGATAFTYNNGYLAIPNIATTVDIGKGSYIFYRGNRSNFSGKITSPFVDPEDNTIDFDGILNQQNITIPLTYNAATYGYNLIGNPYASTIDWNSTNLIKTNVDNTIRIWNPASRNYSTYDGVISVGGGSRYIAAGQSFFVQSKNGPGSVTFTEDVKANSQPPILLLSAPSISQVQTANVAGEQDAVVNDIASSPEIRVTLKKDQAINQDETVIVLNNTKSDLYVQGEDVKHLKGEQVFLSSLSTDKTSLVINYMPSIDRVSAVDLNIDATAITGNYHLDFELNNIPTNYIIQLKDKYLDKITNLNSGSSYALSIDKNNAASFGTDRFSVIIVAPTVLPVKITSFTATKVNQGVEVKWVTVTEDDNNRFEVERAGDDKVFTKINSVLAKGPSSYSITDKNPLIGNNYYRLKQFDNDGEMEEFGPVTVKFDANLISLTSALSIYPNPVSDQFTVKFNGSLSAKQKIKLISPTGNVILSKTITKEELNNGYNINISSYPTGIYLLEVSNEGDNSKVGLLKVIKL